MRNHLTAQIFFSTKARKGVAVWFMIIRTSKKISKWMVWQRCWRKTHHVAARVRKKQIPSFIICIDL